MTKIKICGITNLADALKVAELGADYIGFIFAESPRKIKNLDDLKLITGQLPKSILKVGVFGDQSAESINQIMDTCNLDIAQLHGFADQEFIKKIKYPVFKVLKISDTVPCQEILYFSKQEQVQALLVDRYDPKKLGGTGKTFDWKLMEQIKALSSKPVILSGGLNSANLAAAIEATQPYAVDMSSGVEKAVGMKDHQKLQTVIALAHKVNFFPSALPQP
jgi:phosphoribosylanthranilate isomerase